MTGHFVHSGLINLSDWIVATLSTHKCGEGHTVHSQREEKKHGWTDKTMDIPNATLQKRTEDMDIGRGPGHCNHAYKCCMDILVA